MKADGIYVGCSDITSAEWLHKTVTTEASLGGATDSNDYIMDILEGLNQNLNVKEWIIKSRKPAGPSKTTCFVGVDEESAERQKSQNFKASWILGVFLQFFSGTKNQNQMLTG